MILFNKVCAKFQQDASLKAHHLGNDKQPFLLKFFSLREMS